MNIGFIGLGKLGLPCAVAMAMKGHDVMGYDIDENLMNKDPRPYEETGPDGISPFNPLLLNSSIKFGTAEDIVNHSEIIFVAVQTPHEEKYEGITRLPKERVDFNYDFLKNAIENLSKTIEKIKKEVVLVIISTVLPGTIRNHILPLTNEYMKICYNPYFIAMGTTIKDFLNPEFVLFGKHDEDAAKKVEAFYKTLFEAKFYKTSIENAELIKVSYNTFIGMKIVFANLIMEICHKTEGTDVDEVMNAIKISTNRLISDKYLDGGMGDGGGCHPRDNIAMSHLAKNQQLSYDWFESVMLAREYQTEWLSKLIINENLPIVILGYTFKEESNITVGSPAILLKNILIEKGKKVEMYDPKVESIDYKFTEEPKVYFIGSKHEKFKDYKFPKGSTVIDPWRYLKIKSNEVKYIGVGNNIN